MLRRMVVSLTLPVIGVAPLAAQDLGQIEVGPLESITTFGGTAGLASQAAFGARVGFRISPDDANLYVEGDGVEGKQTVAGSSIDYTAIRARLLHSTSLGNGMSALYGLGVVRNHVGYRPYEYGVSPLVGWRYGFAPYVAVRVDAWLDFIPSPTGDAVSRLKPARYGLQAGLSLPLWGAATALPPVEQRPEPVAVAAKPAVAEAPVVDSDGDGVPDNLDRCPNTPLGTPVDRFGCPVPPPQPAAAPQPVAPPQPAAPTQPAAPAPQPPTCASLPGRTPVGGAGCPALFEENESTVVLRGVTFVNGRAALLRSSRGTLDSVAAALLAHPEARVEVAGYTDNRGGRAKNRRLSQQRANAVRTYLAIRGVPLDRMTARGYGAAAPVASNRTAAGRAANRRVELRKRY